MKIKNSEVVANMANLVEVINRKEKYPVKFSFALSKNIKTLEKLNEDFVTERNKLLDEYNVKSEDGSPAYKTTGKIEIAKENIEAWEKSMKELLEIEVEVDVHKVSIDVLENMDIAPEMLYVCDFMIE